MATLKSLRRAIRRLATPRRAATNRIYFKPEWIRNDTFIGLSAPQLRRLAREFRDLSDADTRRLVMSRIHEERQLGLLLWCRRKNTRAYLRHFRYVNNWDLVDGSAPYLIEPGAPLDRWARSKNLWIRRIAIVSTLSSIRQNRFDDTLRIARALLRDPEDLIHKATGWMLREVGKRDARVLERFLRRHKHVMPRTMLRYAIERFPPRKRREYMK
jgi:3-methyladenine DNA glycosylase AlkD